MRKFNGIIIAALILSMGMFGINADAAAECSAGNHTLVHHEATEVTYTQDGNIEYWYCTKCLNYYLDSEATQKTDEQYITIGRYNSDVFSNGVTWIFDSKGVLHISGTGSIPDFEEESAPWCNYSVSSVIINEGITSLGTYSFNFASGSGVSVSSLTLPSTVTSVGEYAFKSLTALTSIVFSGNAPAIAETAFFGCTLTAEFPSGNSTWTAEKMQQYGGNITWDVPVAENSISYSEGTVTLTPMSGTTISGTVYVAEYDSTGAMVALQTQKAASSITLNTLNASTTECCIMWLDSNYSPLADAVIYPESTT